VRQQGSESGRDAHGVASFDRGPGVRQDVGPSVLNQVMPLTQAPSRVVVVMSQFEPSDGLAFALRLLNSWDELEPDPELLADVATASRLLARHGFDEAAQSVDDAALTSLRMLRTDIRRAWEAAVLQRCPVQPRLARSGEHRWVFRWDGPGRKATDFVGGLASVALLTEIAANGMSRLGICRAGPCRCVYVDHSKNRSRLYCCQQCADRASQAAYRRRRRPAPEPDPTT
jgi:predicted RNA-binding Zn ribbon-like protein